MVELKANLSQYVNYLEGYAELFYDKYEEDIELQNKRTDCLNRWIDVYSEKLKKQQETLTDTKRKVWWNK